MKIGLVQITSSNKLEDNLSKLTSYIDEIATQGAQLVLLPENFALMANKLSEKLSIQESFGQGLVQTWLSEQSKKHQLWIVAGSFPISSDDLNKPYARCLVYNPNGELETYYDKIHLFDVNVATGESYQESNDNQAGLEPVMLTIEGFKVGLSICYDLRFPELYRFYQSQGVDLILAPSAFTEKTGKHHWDLLLKARAVENLCFIAAANQTGTHPNRRQTYGYSQVIDPWGKCLASLQKQEGVIVSELDYARLTKIREQFPAHLHRKL